MDHWDKEDLEAAVTLMELENGLYDVNDPEDRRLFIMNWHEIQRIQKLISHAH